MKPVSTNIPAKYQPKGFHIIYEDQYIIVGNKKPGYLTVAALWNKDNTIHTALNHYIRKGNSRSDKCVYVVHRLDQATSGVLIFAKSEEIQQKLKNNWKANTKTYYTIVHGKMPKKTDIITSYLAEDEDYHVRSTQDSENGKLAQTEYTVVKEAERYSVLKINLLTGKKNQIRVHMSELGNPIVGDQKYGKASHHKNLCLHSFAIVFDHPVTSERMRVQAPVPEYFEKIVPYKY